jgi:hypothetical protein
MAKIKRAARSPRTYLTKRRLVSAARKGIRLAAARTMHVMGYTVVAHNGWLVRKNADGTIQKIKPLAPKEKNVNINLD